MKNQNTVVIVMAMVVIILFTIGVSVGENINAKLNRIERVEDMLEETSKHTGFVNLGVIDGVDISRRNGYQYDGPAIREELFKRIGEPVPTNSWAFELGEQDGIHLVRFVAYKGEPQEPITEQEIEQTYIYGVY